MNPFKFSIKLITFLTLTLSTNNAFSQIQIEDGEYFLISKSNYMGLTNVQNDDHFDLQLLNQANSDITSQIWVVKSVGNGYLITNKKSGEAIDVYENSMEAAGVVSLYASANGDSENQTWYFEDSNQGNGYYLKAKHSGNILRLKMRIIKLKKDMGVRNTISHLLI